MKDRWTWLERIDLFLWQVLAEDGCSSADICSDIQCACRRVRNQRVTQGVERIIATVSED